MNILIMLSRSPAELAAIKAKRRARNDAWYQRWSAAHTSPETTVSYSQMIDKLDDSGLLRPRILKALKERKMKQ